MTSTDGMWSKLFPVEKTYSITAANTWLIPTKQAIPTRDQPICYELISFQMRLDGKLRHKRMSSDDVLAYPLQKGKNVQSDNAFSLCNH